MEEWTAQDRKEMMEEFERQDAVVELAKIFIDLGYDDDGSLTSALEGKGYLPIIEATE